MKNTYTCNQRKNSGAVSPFYHMLSDLFNTGFKMMQDEYGDESTAKMARTPRMNVATDDSMITIELLVPGVEKKEDINISYDDKMLTVSYDPAAEGGENVDYKYHEFGHTSYMRKIRVRPKMNMEEMSAKYANGILTLHIPMKEEKKEVKAVNVS